MYLHSKRASRIARMGTIENFIYRSSSQQVSGTPKFPPSARIKIDRLVAVPAAGTDQIRSHCPNISHCYRQHPDLRPSYHTTKTTKQKQKTKTKQRNIVLCNTTFVRTMTIHRV